MNRNEFRDEVQAVFAYPFDECLAREEVDTIINRAIRKALSKAEVIKSTEVQGDSVVISDALVVTKVKPSVPNLDGEFSVFDFMPHTKLDLKNIDYYFRPEDRTLMIRGTHPAYVEYVADPATLDVTDLTSTFLEWAVDYAVALLNIKEGTLGTQAILTALPFEFNYAEMKQDGIASKERLEEQLDDMFWGCFGAKS